MKRPGLKTIRLKQIRLENNRIEIGLKSSRIETMASKTRGSKNSRSKNNGIEKASLAGGMRCLKVPIPSIDRPSAFYKAGLSLMVLRAIGLQAMDRGGTSDPYVKVKVGINRAQHTRCIPKTVNPIWDEHFAFPLQSLDDVWH